MVLLNINLVKFWIINHLYYNYFILDISIEIVKDKKKIIYNKHSFIIIKDTTINSKNKRIDIK